MQNRPEGNKNKWSKKVKEFWIMSLLLLQVAIYKCAVPTDFLQVHFGKKNVL